ncbi:MAG: hypothetical protein MRJ93_00280 [Nitrososphaeraceae archaeon]|nr:hypothetical protein [Nitrososphaeraceae archaeon]
MVKYSTLKEKHEYDYEKRRMIGRNPTMLTLPYASSLIQSVERQAYIQTLLNC